jgi:hypothetical protein
LLFLLLLLQGFTFLQFHQFNLHVRQLLIGLKLAFHQVSLLLCFSQQASNFTFSIATAFLF